MAFKRISSIAFLADEIDDLRSLPNLGIGAECYVIANSTEYKQNSKGEWIPQSSGNGAGSGGGTGGGGTINPADYVTKVELVTDMTMTPLDVLAICQ